MEFILSTFLTFLLLYTYVGLFLISFLAALLLPLPSSSILAAAGAFAAQGYFSISYVLIAAFMGNILGDTTGYFLAQKIGTTTMQKIGFRKIITSSLYTKLVLYMKKFSFSLIFFSRFLTGVGPLVNILSGSTGISKQQFFVIAIIGEIAYVLLYGMTGYFLGSEWENNIGFLFEATLVIIALGATISTIQYGFFKRMRSNQEPKES